MAKGFPNPTACDSPSPLRERAGVRGHWHLRFAGRGILLQLFTYSYGETVTEADVVTVGFGG
jgi:hypothetical protein